QPSLMGPAKIRGDSFFVEMDDRCDDMARGLAPELHDIFAEVGLDHLDAGRPEMSGEPHLLRHHRLSLGNKLRAVPAAQPKHNVACVRGSRSEMHLTSALDDLAFIGFEIKIEMSECVIFDGARFGAERIELRQLRLGCSAFGDKPGLDVLQRSLQFTIGERFCRSLLEGEGGFGHDAQRDFGAAIAGVSVMPARTSATWRTSIFARSRASPPAICIRQPRSPARTVFASVSRILFSLASRIAPEMSGYFTENVPPNPQHTSLSGSSTRVRPGTFAKSRRGASLMRSSRNDEHES